jgi:hypothetical protein
MSELIIDEVVLIDSEGWLVEKNLARFPCMWIGRRKVPAINDWRNAARREGRSGDFMGVPTGAVNGIDGLDIDPAGMAWLEEALASGLVRPTRMHWTPRGGRHLIYRHAPGVRNRAGLFPGVDIRGEGGFVGWWPWAGYQIADAPIAEWGEAMLALLVASSLAPSAAFLLPALTAGATVTAGATLEARATTRPQVRLKPWKRTANVRAREGGIFRRVLNAEPGERNPTLWEMADLLGGMVVEGSVSRLMAERGLMLACKHNGLLDEDGRKQCLATIKSGLEAGIAYWSLPLSQ